MNLVPFKAAEGPPEREGGLWGHFPALSLVLDAKEAVGAPGWERLAAMDARKRAFKAVEDVLEGGASCLDFRAVLEGGACRVEVTASSWKGRAAILRYARAVRRHGLPR